MATNNEELEGAGWIVGENGVIDWVTGKDFRQIIKEASLGGQSPKNGIWPVDNGGVLLVIAGGKVIAIQADGLGGIKKVGHGYQYWGGKDSAVDVGSPVIVKGG